MYYKCKYKKNTNASIMKLGDNMNSVIITLRVSEEVKKQLDMLALKENRSLNNYINNLLLKHLEQKKD